MRDLELIRYIDLSGALPSIVRKALDEGRRLLLPEEAGS